MYLFSKDVISFLFFPIYITMDTSILIAWKKKERECDDNVKEFHCKHSQLKKVQNILSWSWISPIQSVYKTQMCDKAVL